MVLVLTITRVDKSGCILQAHYIYFRPYTILTIEEKHLMWIWSQSEKNLRKDIRKYHEDIAMSEAEFEPGNI